MKKGETREKIVKTMFDLIAKEGYERASIGKICKEVGISKPAIYHYFNSKEDIFLEIANDLYCNNCNITPNEILTTTNLEDYKQKVIEIGLRNIEYWENNINLLKVVAESDLQGIRNSKIKEAYKQNDIFLFKKYKTILQKGIDLNLFEDSFDINLNAQRLQTIHFGLGTVLLYDVAIDIKEVWKLNIEYLPFKKEVKNECN